MADDPHAAGAVLHRGAALDEAAGAVILLHGRGGSARDILSLAPLLGERKLAFLAPEAAGSTWYPESFLAPRESNQPRLDSALRKIESVIASVVAAGIPRERIVLGGFSQGACLTSEYAARHPGRYAGLLAFTGGLIGPLGSDLEADLPPGDFAGTPVLLASGDPDPHVPWQRVEETARILTARNARVDLRHYPGRPHIVSQAEVALAHGIIEAAFPE
jgi:predicted esterase